MPAKKKSKPLSAAGRAYKSTPKSYRKAMKSALGIEGKATRAQRKAIGSVTRKNRLKAGNNPNTGKGPATAKQMGLKGNAKKSYKAMDTASKKGISASAKGSGVKKKGASLNKRYEAAKPAASKSGPTKKTKAVSRIAKNKGISRSAANKVRKSRKK